MKIRWGSATDVGLVRRNNQDSLIANGHIFAVADGMGGHAGGEVASRIAIDTLVGAFEVERSLKGLSEAFVQANLKIIEAAQDDTTLSGMGTTLTAAALVDQDESLYVQSIGDSRAYLLHDGDLIQVTEDHTFVGDLVRNGSISAEEATRHSARHILTKALGVDKDVAADLWRLEPVFGDRILICSDGLINEVVDPQIHRVLVRNLDPQSAAEELVSLAKTSGGSDNITVIVIDVLYEVDDNFPVEGALERDTSTLASNGIHLELIAAADGEVPSQGRVSKNPVSRGPNLLSLPIPLPTRVTSRSHLSPLTVRAVGFLILLALLILGAMAAVGLYVGHSYYVGVSKEKVVIYQGRPAGLLWFTPKIVERTTLGLRALSQAQLTEVKGGVVEPSLGDAKTYVHNLERQVNASIASSGSSTSSTTLAIATTTTGAGG